MTKKLFLLFILITLSGCNDPKPKDNTISKNTADIMLNREMVSTYQEPIKEAILEEKNEEFRESKEKSEEETTKEEPNIPKETIIKKEEIDNNLNIHKGRIDCLDIDACIDLSTKVQLSFNNLIISTYFVKSLFSNISIFKSFIFVRVNLLFRVPSFILFNSDMKLSLFK